MKKLITICLLLGLISTGVANAAVTLVFDELPNQPVNGLSYMGVTFGFTIGGMPSTDARYNWGGPGTTTYIQLPALEGNANGILTLDFTPLPTDQLQFGVALYTVDTLTPGFTVELFDPSLVSLGVTSVDTSPLIYFSEAQFTYAGTPIRRAQIDFNEAGIDDPDPRFIPRFVVDNLTFNPIPIPAPGAILLGSIGVGLVGLLRRRRTL